MRQKTIALTIASLAFLISTIMMLALWASLYVSSLLKEINDIKVANILLITTTGLSVMSIFSCIGIPSFSRNVGIMCGIACAIPIAIMFVSSIVILTYRSKYFLSDQLKDCGKIFSAAFETVDDTFKESSDLLCTFYCPCDITNPAVEELVRDRGYLIGSATNILECNACEIEQIKNSNKFKEWVNGRLGETVEDFCTKSSNKMLSKFLLDKAANLLSLLKYLEEFFNCSGFCKRLDLHVFADINLGVADESCSVAFVNTLRICFIQWVYMQSHSISFR